MYRLSISYFLCESLSLHYQNYSTMGKNCPQIQAHIFNGSHEISRSISTYTPQNLHHIQFILYIFRNAPQFFHRYSWQCDILPQNQKRITTGTKKELIRHFSRLSNDHRLILSSSTKNTFHRCTTIKMHKSKCLCF